MRVITGVARGRKLKEPEGMEIRPTADQVKEAVFNIIQGDVVSFWEEYSQFLALEPFLRRIPSG